MGLKEQAALALGLKTMRRSLFFSQAEAATLIGQTDLSRWREWEAGVQPIPESVRKRTIQLAKWRQRRIATLRQRLRTWSPTGVYTIVWYDTIEDWLSLPDRTPLFWRPHQSVCAALLSQYPDQILLIRFDARAYAAWLDGRQDSEQMHAIWSATLE